jgi:hypothetical protein
MLSEEIKMNIERERTSHNSGYEVPFPSVTSLKLLPLVATSFIRRTLGEIISKEVYV